MSSVWLGLSLYLCVLTICLPVGAVRSDDKMVHFLLLLAILIWFYVNNLVLNNTLNRCYQCEPQSTFGFLRAKPSGWLYLTNLQSLNAPELAPQIHTVYSRTQLSMVPLWFSNTHKRQQLHYFSYNVLLLYWFQHTVFYLTYSFCTRIYSFPLFEKVKLSDEKNYILANEQEHKRTSAAGVLGKKLYRTWLLCCKFLSSICPLSVCIYFCFCCRIGCNTLFKNGFDILMKQLWLSY